MEVADACACKTVGRKSAAGIAPVGRIGHGNDAGPPVVDYGYYFYLKNTLQGAALSGARAAISSTATNTTVTTAISTSLTAAGLTSSQCTVTFSPTDVSTVTAGSSVTVTITCTWSTVGTHALSSSFGGISDAKQIVGAAAMRKESN
jgi:hypothetical protein